MVVDSFISIVVPVYNAEKHLERCFHSILSQHYSHWELILIDDGSKDRSGEICDAFALQDKRVSVIHQSNAGVSAARNRGIDKAKGDYLLFVDSDDALTTDAFERLINELNEEQSDCIVFGIQQDNGTRWAPEKEAKYDTFNAFLADFPYWLNTELLSPPFNKLFKRSLIKQKFQEHLSFGEDLVFNLSYLKVCNQITIIKDRLYLHNNLNELSITHNFKANRIYDIEAWQKVVLDFSAGDVVNPVLYRKYQSDVLRYMKGLYGVKGGSYRNIKEKLNQWYPTSYLRQCSGKFYGSLVDKFLYTCLRHQCWLLPYLCLSLKRKFQRSFIVNRSK